MCNLDGKTTAVNIANGESYQKNPDVRVFHHLYKKGPAQTGTHILMTS
jgi:hypothetical protein